EEDSEPLSHPLRQADGARFAADLQKRVFARQRDLIRSKGCPIPITAVVNSTVIPDTWSVAQELDFVGENAYQDHPAFKAGETWVGKSFFQNKNYLKDTGPWAYAAHMARYKWAGKGLVCREWALSWPNEYRASANMAMAAQALRQDYDGMIYFCYNTWGDQNISATFGLQADPARWGTFGYAGHLFIRGGVEPARQSVDIAWTEQNLFRWGNYVDALHDLAWEFRIANHFFPGVVQSEADIRVSAGRSGTGIFQGQRNILWDIRPERWAAYPEALRNSAITIRNGYTQPFVQAGRAMPIQDVKAAGYVPLAANEETCRGFYDPARKTAILAGSDSRETANAVRGLARAAQSGETMEIMPPPEKAVSEKGDVIRDTSQGFLTIRTPDLEALQGEFRVGERETAGALSVISRTPIGCVTALALDGKPLAESKHFAVKMVTGARNRGQVLAPSEAEGVPGKYVLSFPGTAPVQTNGQPSQEPTSVMIAGKPLIEAWLTGGMWEMIVDRQKGEIFLACDTPNISFQLGEAAFADGVPEKMKMTRHFYEHPPVEPVEISARFQYPGFAKYARIEMVGE
ncbi:MAG TPA: hypothetical protein PLB62_07580, partial [Candidatus Sumerlaeota bacterium]|nr:hypothetical protein [Candidatus Sumerlaeota bacterium]